MTSRSLYDYTSIARPVDPAYPTNKAVLILLPLIAAFCAAWQMLGFGVASASAYALGGALVAFGTWALTRELAPDDNPAAFISMALGLMALLAFGPASVMPLFVALFQVRVVNRSTGNAATAVDSVIVVILTLWVARSMNQALLAYAGALAFGLDALLRPAKRRQILPALACLIAPLVWSGGFAVPEIYMVPLPVTDLSILAVLIFAFLLIIAMQKPVVSVGDATGACLSTARVRGGMLVGLVVGVQSLSSNSVSTVHADWWVFACLAGVVLGRLFAPILRAASR